MDVIPDAKKWLKEMGYDRNVDDIDFKTYVSFKVICIWFAATMIQKRRNKTSDKIIMI